MPKQSEAGKGSKQRPGEGYADGWERIWGSGRDKKPEPYRKDGRGWVDRSFGRGSVSFFENDEEE
jgi:hypothetical protein